MRSLSSILSWLACVCVQPKPSSAAVFPLVSNGLRLMRAPLTRVGWSWGMWQSWRWTGKPCESFESGFRSDFLKGFLCSLKTSAFQVEVPSEALQRVRLSSLASQTQRKTPIDVFVLCLRLVFSTRTVVTQTIFNIMSYRQLCLLWQKDLWLRVLENK